MSNQTTQEIEKVSNTFRVASKRSYESLVYAYSQYFELEITPDKRIRIGCVCGTRFDFRDNANRKVPKFADCPKCLEFWHFEERPESYLLIRPKTNAQIHARKE